MKPLMLSLLLSGIAASACSQKLTAENVPSVVKNALTAQYATATLIEWEKQKNDYVAEFTVGTEEYEALIDASGNVQMVKQDITLATLPATITDAIAKEFKGFTIDDTEKIEKNGVTYYQVELEKTFSEKKLVFMADGSKPAGVNYWD